MKNLLYILAFISTTGFGQDLDPEKVYVYPCIASYELDDFDSLNASELIYERYEVVHFEDTIVMYFDIHCLLQDDSTYLRVENLCNKRLHYKVNQKPFLLIRHPKDVFFEGKAYDVECKPGHCIHHGTYHPLTIFEVNVAKGRFMFMLKDFPEFCCKYDSEEEFLKLIGE